MALSAEDVGARIREARLAKGWTHQDLADAISEALDRRVNLRTVQRWQKGRDPKGGASWLPRLGTLMELADLLDVPRSYFVEEELGEDGAWQQMLDRLDRVEQTEERNSEMLSELLRIARRGQEPDQADEEAG
jgi:transcriptional regulator with XRE-family HTH domain